MPYIGAFLILPFLSVAGLEVGNDYTTSAATLLLGVLGIPFLLVAFGGFKYEATWFKVLAFIFGLFQLLQFSWFGVVIGGPILFRLCLSMLRSENTRAK